MSDLATAADAEARIALARVYAEIAQAEALLSVAEQVNSVKQVLLDQRR